MNAKVQDGSFPEFDYDISEVQKYIRSGDIFTLKLKNGTIIHHTTEKEDLFEEWLTDNGTINIKSQ